MRVRVWRKHMTFQIKGRDASPKNAIANVVTSMVALLILPFNYSLRHVLRPVVGVIVPHRREEVLVIPRIYGWQLRLV